MTLVTWVRRSKTPYLIIDLQTSIEQIYSFTVKKKEIPLETVLIRYEYSLFHYDKTFYHFYTTNNIINTKV